MRPSLSIALLLFWCVCGVAASASPQFTVTNQKRFTISPLLQSAFFESEINYGSEGGLYAELISNRDFETLGRGLIPGPPSTTTAARHEHDPTHVYGPGLDPGEPPAVPGDVRPWEAVRGANISADTSTQPFPSNPTTLRVSTRCLTPPCFAGVRNPGYWGVNVRQGVVYNLTFHARNPGNAVRLLGRLVSADGRVWGSTPEVEVAGEWARYSAQVSAQGGDDAGWLELVVADGDAVFWLDAVSLVPGDAVAGLFRPDLFKLLAGLRPGFVRMPGGNYLEGTGPRTRWDWKSTVGPWESRPGHYNSAWGYWVTDGMGLHELLVLAEALGSQAQMGIYTGYSMGQQYIPLDQSEVFVQDALDLIEYANGPVTSPYGMMRAQAGHPEPFNLSRLEIGNEEKLMNPDDYPGHYRIITQAVWGLYPDMVVVASGRWGPSIAGSPCLTGQRCDAWDDHYYRTPDQMAAMGFTYDAYDRSWPDVFVGEYAANVGKQQTLQAAVGESIFLLGLERNGDKVVASSFAPLFRHVRGTQWDYDLINFNSSHAYALPSYYMQSMLRDNRNDYELAYAVAYAPSTTMLTAGIQGSHVVIKAANYVPNTVVFTVALDGFTSVGNESTYTVLTSSQGAGAANTLDSPVNVVPSDGTAPTAARFALTLQAWSLTILRVPFS